MENENTDFDINRNFDNQMPQAEPKMHGCVTAWLIMMIVVNSIVALVYLIGGDFIENALGGIEDSFLIILGLVGLFNVLCAAYLLKWKKWGFYGFIGSSVVTIIINLQIGLEPVQAISGLIGVAILYAILQIKRDGITAWSQMK
jgi:hypothetical protein